MFHEVMVQWLGHACFKVTAGEYSVVIDPYEDGYVPGIGRLRTTAAGVLCSHDHKDHGYTEAVTVRPFDGEVPFRIRTIDSWHDDKQGELRGRNQIHVLDTGRLRLVHLGDLGCMLTEEQFEQIGTPDVLMIPVGGFYTINAAMAKVIADRTGARVVIPMHYRSEAFGFDVLDTLDAFTGQYAGAGPEICRYAGDTLVVGPETPGQIAVFSQWNRE